MNEVIIMRGLMGSGKTRRVEEILADFNAWKTRSERSVQVCSADDYFMVDGVYKFDMNKIAEAHNACLAKFCKALVDKTDLVIVDNTNSQRWEFAHYEAMARLAGYEVTIEYPADQPHESKFITVDLIRRFHERNRHGVPLRAVAAMAAQWED